MNRLASLIIKWLKLAAFIMILKMRSPDQQSGTKLSSGVLQA
jgi:hypothetical protein